MKINSIIGLFFVLLLASCTTKTIEPVYLKIEKTVNYDYLGFAIEDLWENSGFIFAKIDSTILKLDLDGNILGITNNVTAPVITYTQNENRIECSKFSKSLKYKYFDKNNNILNQKEYYLNDAYSRRSKLVHFQNKVIWITHVRDLNTLENSYFIYEIDAQGNLGPRKQIDMFNWQIEIMQDVVASENQICIISTTSGNYESGYVITGLNSNLDRVWTKDNIKSMFGIHFAGANVYKNNDFSIFDKGSRPPFQLLISNNGEDMYKNNFGVSSSLEKMYFLPHKTNNIGLGIFSYQKSSAIIQFSKTGEFQKVLLKKMEIVNTNGFLEIGDYYYVGGMSKQFNPKATLTIIKK